MNGFDSYQLLRRSTAARWVLAGAFALLIGAFFRIQVLQHDKYQLKAETNRLRAIPIEAPRGEILDEHGRVIAENLPGFAVKLLAPSADSLRAVLARMRPWVPFDSGDVGDVVDRWAAARYEPVMIVGDASLDLVAELEEHRPALPGLIIQAEPKRLYPAGRALGHLVGYVSEVTESDLEHDRYPGAVNGSIVGRAGLEREYDSILRGSAGVRYAEVNARGRLVREDVGTAYLAPVPGKPLVTTIDLDLQRYVDSIWPAGVRGALIAMTPDGAIRALYSAPSFDPNLFIGGISRADWNALNTDPAIPLLNRALDGLYPPASPFKLATAAMALRRGLVDFNTHMPLPCTGGFRLGNRVFRCWKKEGHGSLDLTGAIAKSCDVYFYQLGLRLGLDAIVQDGVLLGFHSRTGVDLPSERRPLFPGSVAYFDSLYGPRHWSAPATTLNFSIGQGENTQTLIKMVQFYAGIAGNGVEPVPYVVAPEPGAARRSLGLTGDQLQGLRNALIAVVERGTGAGARQQGLEIAGKTGTAQNPHGKDHGWFIGFAPARKPALVVGAIMEAAEHGSHVAPYVAKVLVRYVVGPDTSRSGVRLQMLDDALERDTGPGPVEVDSTHPDSLAGDTVPVPVRPR